jgi:5'-deoxynucleotidase YfbR-like HD superfamily hydrolase
MTNFERLCILRNSGRVVRWHSEPYWAGERQQVGQHTFGVMLNLVAIMPKGVQPSSNLLLVALHHDLAEQGTGDIPSPTKWKLGITEQLDKYEDFVLTRLGGKFELQDFERRLLKAADTLDYCFDATEQYMMGNRHMLHLFDRLKKHHQDRPEILEVTPKCYEIFCELCSIWNEAGMEPKMEGFASNNVRNRIL